jgi:iron complex outermembrane receptor protein
MHRVLHPAALCAALAAFCAAPLARGEPPVGDEATIVVTATRFETRRDALPAGAIVITARDLADAAIASVPEALGRLGGLHLRNNTGDPNPQLDLRGFGATGDQNTLVLVDGVRISENEQVPARLSAIPLDAVERIEILPGTGAVLYGGGATGGTINIITRKPRRGQREAVLGATLGSYDTRSLRAGGTISGDRLGLTLNASDLDTDNYRRNNHLSDQNLEGSLRLALDGGDIEARFGGARQRLGLPGALSEAEIAVDRRATTHPDDRSALDTWHVDLGGKLALERGELAADLAYRDRSSDSLVVFFGEPSTTDIAAQVLSFTPRLRLPYDIGDQRAELVVGADWSDWDYRRQIGGSFSSLLESSQRDLAAYFLNTLRFGESTRLAFGGRVQSTRIEQQDLSFAPATVQTSDNTLTAFELSARQGLTSGVALYGRWGQSFRNANVDDNGFTADGRLLDPQTSHDAEIGVEWGPTPLALRAAVFELRVNNEIHFLPSTALPPFGANVNLPPTRHRGVELDGNWRPGADLAFSANYRYTDAEFRSGVLGGVDLAGNEVPLVPRHRASLNATWRAAAGLTVSGNLRYVGTQRYDNDQVNSFRSMPAYTLADIKLTKQFGDWKLFAQADNLFDEEYYSYGIRNGAGTSFDAYPEPERRFFVGAEYALR